MKVYGHRGAAGEAPENTIAACRHAIERGTRYLELDMRLSRDNQLVVVHDNSVNRTSYNRGSVASYTAAELAKMDARRSGPPWPRKRDAGISTLDKFLAATPEVKGYFLEVKSDGNSRMQTMANLLAERFSTPTKAKKVVVTSSNKYFHECLAYNAPHVRRGLVSMRPNVAQQLEEFDYHYLLLQWAMCFPRTLNAARNKGIKTALWTVNEPHVIKAAHRLKVDCVITDYPSMALPLVSSLLR